MTEILTHEPHAQSTTRQPIGGRERRRTRAEVEAMLHEIAFVLRMTKRVRDEMDAEQDAGQFAHA